MQRNVIKGIVAAVAVMAAISVVVLASQQGFFGGEAKKLLTSAARAAHNGDYTSAQLDLEALVETFPDSQWVDKGLFALGEVYEAQEEWVAARDAYNMLLDGFSDSSLSGRTQERLGQVNITLLFSPVMTDTDSIYEVKGGDTLGRIAAATGATISLIKRANGIEGHIIRPHQRLKIPIGRFSIVVDKSQNRLLLAREDEFVKGYPIATGRNDTTPEGTFTIINKITDPVWYRQGAVVPPESPENILGSRWMGWDKKGYGIHGSVDTTPIKEQKTAGCIRMTNTDVEELFAIVPRGTEVTVIN